MSNTKLEIEVDGHLRTVVVPPDHTGRAISTILRRAGVPLNTRCGERGLCDGCVVNLTSGTLTSLISGATVDGRWSGQVRACQHHANADSNIKLQIPQRSMLKQRASVVTEFKPPKLAHVAPLWRREGSQTFDYTASGWQRGPDLEWTIDEPLGIGIDIGTTSVVVVLVNLLDGAILARAADFNQQMRLGDDVLTRITLCASDPTMLDELRHAIIAQTIVPLINAACDAAQRSTSDIVCCTIAGNTTMLHLYAGVDPTPLGMVPFTPGFIDHQLTHGDLLAPWNERSGIRPAVHLLPGCSAYVGADLSAGLIAGHLLNAPAPSILLDIGTNGEMILNLGDHLVGCATAAGPAFEGAGLSSGCRAVDGAIAHVSITNDPLALKLTQIGKGKPIGLCGSFYIDFLAQALDAGVLDAAGRYDRDVVAKNPTHFIKTDCHGWALKIATAVTGEWLVVSEGDIAKLIPAKAAIAAGLRTLLERNHLSAADVKTLQIAGGFGLHIDIPHAIAIGLLPGFAPAQVDVVGNTALAGAWMCLCSTDSLDRAIAASQRVEVIELNQDPGFEDRYIEGMCLG